MWAIWLAALLGSAVAAKPDNPYAQTGQTKGGTLDGGVYSGVLMPGVNHDLVDWSVALASPLNPGPALGARVLWRPVTALGLEGASHLAVSSSPDQGAVTLYAFRLQALGILPLRLRSGIEPFLVAGLGNIGMSSGQEKLGNDLDWAVHTGAGVQVPVSERFSLRLDVNYLFADRNTRINKFGGHTEVLIGAQYNILGDRDLDDDEIADRSDRCADEPETINGYRDEDGCPDQLAQIMSIARDAEGMEIQGVQVIIDDEVRGATNEFGILEMFDEMPEVAMKVDVKHPLLRPFDTTEFTPEPGENDLELPQKWLPGAIRIVTTAQGEPIESARVRFIGPEPREDSGVEGGDALFKLSVGEWQVVVSADGLGTQSRDIFINPDRTSLVVMEFELEEAQVEVTAEEVVLLQQILFEVDSASIMPASEPLLAEVAATLLDNDQIRQVEIQGHTDSTGSAAYNRKLSQERVESVVQWLAQHGVKESRMIAKGFGPDQPIASNETEEGRAKNRRVVFKILEPAASEE